MDGFWRKYPFKPSFNFSEQSSDVIEDSISFLRVVNQKIQGKLIWISYEDSFMFNNCINGSLNQEKSSMREINTQIMKELGNEVIIYDLEKSLKYFGINRYSIFVIILCGGNPYSYEFILYVANDIM